MTESLINELNDQQLALFSCDLFPRINEVVCIGIKRCTQTRGPKVDFKTLVTMLKKNPRAENLLYVGGYSLFPPLGTVDSRNNNCQR